MHLCDVAEAMIRAHPAGVEWLDGLTIDATFADDVVAAVGGGETNIIELASFVNRANRAMVE